MTPMSIADPGPPTPSLWSFIPIHFNYPVIPTFFALPRLVQPCNLQLLWPHLRATGRGGRETRSNGMKCHSVIAFVTARRGSFGEGSLVGEGLCACVCGVEGVPK